MVVVGQGALRALGCSTSSSVSEGTDGWRRLTISQMFGQDIGGVFTTEVQITDARPHTHDAVEQLEQGHVEGATTEVDNRYGSGLFIDVQPIVDGGCGGLVDQPSDVPASQVSGFDRRPSLRFSKPMPAR